MNHFIHDLEYALRISAQRKQRLTTTVIVLVVGVGIAATSLVLSVVDALLVRGLPFPAAKDLVSVELASAREHHRSFFGHSADTRLYEAWGRDSSGDFTLAGFQGGEAVLAGNWLARNVQVIGVTPNMIPLLGIRPLYGRGFQDSDGLPGAEPCVLLSYSLWASLFGQDASAAGRWVTLNGRQYRVIGAMPKGFHVPLSIPESRQSDPELWVTVRQFQQLLSWPTGVTDPPLPLEVIGRVRPGVPLTSVEGRLDRVLENQLSGTDRFNSDAARVQRLQNVVSRAVRTSLLLATAAVALLLALACFNAANLLVARTISRGREMATRIAVGASHSRLLLQLVTESVATCLVGGGLGVVLAYVTMPALLELGAAYLPDVESVSLNSRVLLFASALMLFIGGLVGTWSAFVALSRSPMEALTARTPTSTRTVRLWIRGLVVLGIAFGIVLLAAMGLLGRSFLRLTETNRGYETHGVIVAALTLPDQPYKTVEARRSFTFRLLGELRNTSKLALPAVSSGVPILGGTAGMARSADLAGATGRRFAIWSVAGDYFRSLGIPILRGVEPRSTVNQGEVAIDTAAARALFGSENAIGRSIVWGNEKNRAVVSAIVGDIQDLYVNTNNNTRYRMANPHIYVPVTAVVSSAIRVCARARGSSTEAVAALREAVNRIDRNVPVEADTMRSLVRIQLARETFLFVIVAVFAGMALVLGAAGIFAVMAHSSAERTHEIGVRLALGARPSDIVTLILRDAFLMIAAGAGIGMLGAFAVSRILRSALFEISPFDAATILGVVAVAAVVSLLASALPGVKASRVSATIALLIE